MDDGTVVLACRTLEDELALAMEHVGLTFPVLWVESGLHDTPKRLTVRIQELLGEVPVGVSRVLLAFGTCGNSLLSVRAGDFEMVLPRVDDCISLLFGSMGARMEVSRADAAVFLTEGWMRGERNVWSEYERMVGRYGEEQAGELAQMMYGHYRTVGLLDTGAYDMAHLWEEAEPIERVLGLTRRAYPGTLSYLEELLCGPWPEERFVVKGPHEAFDAADLRLPSV